MTLRPRIVTGPNFRQLRRYGNISSGGGGERRRNCTANVCSLSARRQFTNPVMSPVIMRNQKLSGRCGRVRQKMWNFHRSRRTFNSRLHGEEGGRGGDRRTIRTGEPSQVENLSASLKRMMKGQSSSSSPSRRCVTVCSHSADIR